jgi:hypothetical protein
MCWDGTLALWAEGRPTTTIKDGDSFFVEAGKGEPLATPFP